MVVLNILTYAYFSGASSGIGAGTAILFCKLGAEVAITGRKVENLSQTAEECEKSNRKKVILNIYNVCQIQTIYILHFMIVQYTTVNGMWNVTLIAINCFLKRKGIDHIKGYI